VRIGRNVRIAEDLRTSDFVSRVVKTGASVDRLPERRRRAVPVDGRAADGNLGVAADAAGVARRA
jgi:hypothetical protein